MNLTKKNSELKWNLKKNVKIKGKLLIPIFSRNQLNVHVVSSRQGSKISLNEKFLEFDFTYTNFQNDRMKFEC